MMKPESTVKSDAGKCGVMAKNEPNNHAKHAQRMVNASINDNAAVGEYGNDNDADANATYVDDNQSVSTQGSLEIGACCLCHCALDYSDRAAFFHDDRHEDYNEDSDEEDYFFRPSDPYLPEPLYDKHNALVYCDTCDRMYHQKCHFVPLLVLPRGDWQCLYCQTTRMGRKSESPSKRRRVSTTGPSAATAAAARSKRSASIKPSKKNRLQSPPSDAAPFRSPPDLSTATRTYEQYWETAARHDKAQAWRHELSQRFPATLNVQLANCRLAETALEALTSTARNRSHYSKKSQELAQLLCKLYGARCKLREYLCNLQILQQSSGARWRALQAWVDENNHGQQVLNEFVTRVLFPFGRLYPPRLDPRTPEMQQAGLGALLHDKDGQQATIPNVIALKRQTSESSIAKGRAVHAHKKTKAAGATAKHADDDDSGISLDDLTCCVCHASTATDENDLIMCDGAGCYRAYHMQCIQPPVTAQDLGDDDDDWFCPICNALGNVMMLIQTHYMGDDWEQRRVMADWEGRSHAGSLQSWNNIDEVFPTAEHDYAAAMQLKDGQRTPATEALLARVLGLDHEESSSSPGHENDDDDDDDDVNEDEHFDLDAHVHEERQLRAELRNVAGHDENDSIVSSQATLVEMSSVELEIGQDELAALSDASSDGDDHDSLSGGGQQRRSRRLRQSGPTAAAAVVAGSGNTSESDMGKLDPANIVEGKRGRRKVDYILLNEAIFGGDGGGHDASIDDVDEFEVKAPRRRRTSSSDNSSSSSDSGSSSDVDAGSTGSSASSPGSNDPSRTTSSLDADSNKEKKQTAVKSNRLRESAASAVVVVKKRKIRDQVVPGGASHARNRPRRPVMMPAVAAATVAKNSRGKAKVATTTTTRTMKSNIKMTAANRKIAAVSFRNGVSRRRRAATSS